MNSGINLVVERDDPQKAQIRKKVRMLRLTAVSIIGVVLLISGVLFVLIAASPLPGLRAQ